MRRAQQRVDESLQMFRPDGWQPLHPHAVVHLHRRSEISAAIYGDFVSQARQFVTGVFVVRLDTAVLREHSAATNQRDADTAARATRRNWKLKSSWPTSAGCRVRAASPCAARDRACLALACEPRPPFFRSVGTVKQKSDGVSKLTAVSVRIEEAGYSVFNQFAARTRVEAMTGRPHASDSRIVFPGFHRRERGTRKSCNR